jgi:protein subunit release factor B
VNKSSSKVDVRFHIDSVDWLDEGAKERLKTLFPGKVNNDGFLFTTCEETREARKNRETCILRLQEMVAKAQIVPKEKVVVEYKEPQAVKKRRIDAKRRRSQVRARRSGHVGGG